MIDYPIQATGPSLETLGMEDILLLWPDGTCVGLGGLIWFPGATIVGSLLRQAPTGVRVYADRASFLAGIEVRLH